MGLMAEIFTWWAGQTVGTRFSTWRKGKLVGEDENGNKFYTSHDGAKRWVIYEGEAEASKVSADWHGWLHKTYDELPSDKPLVHQSWEKPHVPNMTGTGLEYRPAGSITLAAPKEAKDYEAWVPE